MFLTRAVQCNGGIEGQFGEGPSKNQENDYGIQAALCGIYVGYKWREKVWFWRVGNFTRGRLCGDGKDLLTRGKCRGGSVVGGGRELLERVFHLRQGMCPVLSCRDGFLAPASS